MVETAAENQNGDAKEKPRHEEGHHDPQFEPVVTLPLQEVVTMEEEEDELLKLRAKMYRWASECDPAEWKERGTGEVKFLQHKKTKRVRLLMRRDKTLKICANHFIEEYMKLMPNCGSDRAWVWNVAADFCGEEAKSELLAIKFLNAENANKFKDQFHKSIEINKENSKEKSEISAKKDENASGNEEIEKNTENKEEKSDEKDIETATENLGDLKIDEKSQESSSKSKDDDEKNQTESA